MLTPQNPPNADQTSQQPSESPDVAKGGVSSLQQNVKTSEGSSSSAPQPTVDHVANQPSQSASPGLVTSDTPTGARQPVVEDTVEDDAKSESFPGLNDEAPSRRWHSKTSRRVRVEIAPADIVWLRQNDGSVVGYDRSALKDTDAVVVERRRVVGPGGKAITVIKTDTGGVIALDDIVGTTTSYETAEQAKSAGFEL